MLHAIDVHSKFHDEHIAFSMASSYLYSVGILAAKGMEPLSQDQKEFVERIAPRYKDPREYFLARLFISHISAFELFLQELVMAVVAKHPYKIGGVQFRLSEVLQIDDSEELVQRATEEVLNKLMYKKPLEYLGEICQLLSVDPSGVASLWPVFIEAKARRDLGVHNGWICNQTYLRKVVESKQSSALSIGQSALPTDSAYIQAVTSALYEIAGSLYNEVTRNSNA